MRTATWRQLSGLGMRVSLAGVGLGIFALAPDPAVAAEIEEIIVTARKRAENLQDVPISVTALSGESLRSEGIGDLTALKASIPNFTYREATEASDLLIMRGVGTIGSGPQFEPAVGQVFNGFFISRSRLGRSAFMDSSQVELLKGPQGAIVGKNTSLGAILVTPNKPADNFEASLAAGYYFDASEGFDLEGAVSGPLTERFRARLAAKYVDREGWVENLAFGRDDGTDKGDLSARLILAFDVTDRIEAELLWQRLDYDRAGKAQELVRCDPASLAAILGRSPQEDCRPNGTQTSGNPEPFDLAADVIGLTLTWDFDGFSITSLTSYNDYQIFDTIDADRSPVPLITATSFEDYSQWAQELRITSAGSHQVDYVAGVFFMDNEMDWLLDIDFNLPSPPLPPIFPARRHQQATVETRTYAPFAQLDWHVSYDVTWTLGARWTSEQRESTAARFPQAVFTSTAAPCVPGTPPPPANGLTCASAAGSIDEDNLSWNTALRWQFAPDQMLYASAGTGFKSGGFDVKSDAFDPQFQQRFEFRGEEVLSVEFGGKHQLAGGTLQINWALFRMDIDGLQIASNNPGSIAQAVANVDKAISQGLELDASWAVTDALRLGVAGAWLDATYDRFPTASCYFGQTAAQGCVNSVQDVSGSDALYAPETQIAVNADYTWAVGDALQLTLGARWYSMSEQLLDQRNDPLLNIGREPGYSKLDLSLALKHRASRWSVAVAARNVTDEIVRNFSEGATLAIPGDNSHFGSVDEPRTISLRARCEF